MRAAGPGPGQSRGAGAPEGRARAVRRAEGGGPPRKSGCRGNRTPLSTAHIKTDLLRLPLPRRALMRFLRFRTGCHGLPIIVGGWDGVPRSQRLRPLCQSEYSDERHALLECSALTHLRDKYQQLFRAHIYVRQFLWQHDMLQLVRFVIECLNSFAAAE